VSKSTSCLSDLLRASARARGYPFLERAAIWEERLGMHLQDLAAVLEAPAAGDMLPLPAKAKLEIAPPRQGEPAAHSDDLCFASAAQIAARVRARKLSPFEVARAFVERVDAHRALHAFITFRPEAVLREARQLEVRVQSGEDVGALAGVPVAVKDLMPVSGYPMTCGTRAIEAREQHQDAEVVGRLRAAGALVIGTANLHELAYGVTSANVHFGAVSNPAAPGCIPGGSSGGSAAAVAAGLAAIGVGTDTGGSIRIPAACCGIVGFKGSYDAVTRQGVWPLAFTLDHIGPLTRSVGDAALGFEVMAGLPAGCTSAKQVERPHLVRPAGFFFEHVEDAVRSRAKAAIEQLGAAGAQVEERTIEGIEHAPAVQFVTLCSEACQANWDLLTTQPEGLAPDVRLRLEVGQFIGAIDYVKAQRLRRALRDNLLAALGDAHVMVTPALPVRVPRSGLSSIDIGGRVMPIPSALTRLSSPFNLAGLPAISLPAGKDDAGVPVNLQLVGRPGADATVLAVARWCERVLGSA
jgi:aspartyl-tRNA(Asn)/glutamyl-tRNA(Gln) amidotransferase subunit A